jgi:molybdopterin molybdotransferase
MTPAIPNAPGNAGGPLCNVVSDVRLTGFNSRAPLADALTWIDARTAALPTERIALADAAGRVLAAPIASPVDWPGVDCAALDGYAVRAAETEGAGEYNPLPLTIHALIAAGLPMPAGTDAVLPFASAQPRGPALDALAPAARGAGVDRRGSAMSAGSIAVAAGTLRPQHIALLLALGADPVAVVRRPLVALAVAGPKSGPDLLSPMLRALVARDGGRTEAAPLPAAGTDLVLMAGRSGAGPDDDAGSRLADVGGALEVHGIAVRPGDSTGLGRIGGVPVLLLPGAPHACLAAYALLASRAVRRLAGVHPPELHEGVERVLKRKAVSSVGFTDMIQVRTSRTHAVPLAPADAGTLAGAAAAHGFIIVPEASEGYPAGAVVQVHRL